MVQLVFAVAIILGLQAAQLVPKDPLEWSKVKVRHDETTHKFGHTRGVCLTY